MKKINIAIDGHSSCGKSTIAKELAKRLGYTYIDTGAMYRGVTLYTLRKRLWKDGEPDVEAITKVLPEIELSFERKDDGQVLLLNGEDVESEIRGMEVSNHVSPIAAIPVVRAFLVEQQQAMGKEKGVVMDGRDVGTVILPNAELKIFVTADADVRAERRHKEMLSKGIDVSYEEVLENVVTRDKIDSTREVGPLKQAEDALLLDNSNMTIPEQNSKVMEMVKQAMQKQS